jgi:maltooligosyltrehalose trehalohydrolase
MLQLYRDLAALRRSRPELTDPRFIRNTVEFDDDEKWLLIDRSGVRIAVNMSDDIRIIPFTDAAGSLLLATRGGAEFDDDTLCLPPHTAVVIAPAGE